LLGLHLLFGGISPVEMARRTGDSGVWKKGGIVQVLGRTLQLLAHLLREI